MPYSVCDRVVRIEPGVSGTAIKNVTFSEDYLATHFPIFPVMPGAMMIDAVAEVAGQVMVAKLGESVATHLVSVSSAKFRRFVRPGDEMQIQVSFARQNEEKGTAEFTAEITVDGERAASLREAVLGWKVGS